MTNIKCVSQKPKSATLALW